MYDPVGKNSVSHVHTCIRQLDDFIFPRSRRLISASHSDCSMCITTSMIFTHGMMCTVYRCIEFIPKCLFFSANKTKFN